MPFPESDYPSVLRGYDKRQSERLLNAAHDLLMVAFEAISYADDTKSRFIDHWDGEDEQSFALFTNAAQAAIAKAEGRE
jgi:hypothetical protein